MSEKRQTLTMQKARKWLEERGGSGVIDRYGRLLAAGELAPFADTTWLRLVAAGRLIGSDGHISLPPTDGGAS